MGTPIIVLEFFPVAFGEAVAILDCRSLLVTQQSTYSSLSHYSATVFVMLFFSALVLALCSSVAAIDCIQTSLNDFSVNTVTSGNNACLTINATCSQPLQDFLVSYALASDTLGGCNDTQIAEGFNVTVYAGLPEPITCVLFDNFAPGILQGAGITEDSVSADCCEDELCNDAEIVANAGLMRRDKSTLKKGQF